LEQGWGSRFKGSGHLLLVRRRVRVEHAMDGRSRDAMGLGDLAQALPASATATVVP